MQDKTNPYKIEDAPTLFDLINRDIVRHEAPRYVTLINEHEKPKNDVDTPQTKQVVSFGTVESGANGAR